MNSLDIVRRLLEATARADLQELDELYADDAVQVEHPNRLLRAGATRNKTQIREAASRGGKLMTEQRFDVTQALAQGSAVALEARWYGRLAIDAPPLGWFAGDVMTARFAQFLELREGRIVRHATYDCFDPWGHGRASHVDETAGGA